MKYDTRLSDEVVTRTTGGHSGVGTAGLATRDCRLPRTVVGTMMNEYASAYIDYRHIHKIAYHTVYNYF